jgi:hypothetical protein
VTVRIGSTASAIIVPSRTISAHSASLAGRGSTELKLSTPRYRPSDVNRPMPRPSRKPAGYRYSPQIGKFCAGIGRSRTRTEVWPRRPTSSISAANRKPSMYLVTRSL